MIKLFLSIKLNKLYLKYVAFITKSSFKNAKFTQKSSFEMVYFSPKSRNIKTNNFLQYFYYNIYYVNKKQFNKINILAYLVLKYQKIF